MQKVQLRVVLFLSLTVVGHCWFLPQTCNVQLSPDVSIELESLTTAVNKLQQTLDVIADRLLGLPNQPSCPPSTSEPATAQSTTEVPTTMEPATPPPSHGCPGKGWRQVKFLDMNDTNQDCPPGFQLTDYSETIRTCGRVNTNIASCDSTFIASGGPYSEVCGRATAYRYGDPVAFHGSTAGQSIDGYYLDGLSITHGSPRTHIWSFASGFFAAVNSGQQQPFSRCPCDPGNTATPPSFVGDDYFCDSVVDEATAVALFGFYPDNALWDGVDSLNPCYNEPGVPWFNTTLPSVTTTDIEVRLCSSIGLHREAAINQIELYVR